MKRDLPDFFHVETHHLAIHERLNNWARYVQVRGVHWQSPIWKLGKSNGRQWHQPAIRETVNTLDGHAIEKAVGALPADNRDAIRWAYVFPRINPHHMRRALAVTDTGLLQLIRNGRQMLANRNC